MRQFLFRNAEFSGDEAETVRIIVIKRKVAVVMQGQDVNVKQVVNGIFIVAVHLEFENVIAQTDDPADVVHRFACSFADLLEQKRFPDETADLFIKVGFVDGIVFGKLAVVQSVGSCNVKAHRFKVLVDQVVVHVKAVGVEEKFLRIVPVAIGLVGRPEAFRFCGALVQDVADQRADEPGDDFTGVCKFGVDFFLRNSLFLSQRIVVVVIPEADDVIAAQIPDAVVIRLQAQVIVEDEVICGQRCSVAEGKALPQFDRVRGDIRSSS